jgi:hypothetical protein
MTTDLAAHDFSFAFTAAGAARFGAASATGLQTRDLGAQGPTAGALYAAELKGAGASIDLATAAGFRAYFVLAGELALDGFDPLTPGDVICVAGSRRERIHLSTDARLIVLASPLETVDEPELLVHRDVPEAYKVGQSPTASRPFLGYRDIPAPAAVDGTIRVEVIRAERAGNSSGWHHHPMAQIVFGVQGGAVVDVDGFGSHHLTAGSAIYLPPALAHNLRDITADYTILEAFIPGIGGTTQCEAPAGR